MSSRFSREASALSLSMTSPNLLFPLVSTAHSLQLIMVETT